MRTALAEKLLVKIMQWDSETTSRERPLIQALANFKYDEYQQFSSGTRFIESLVKWLRQFHSQRERHVAYSFLKNHLIFISHDQMVYLVNIAFSDKINPHLVKQVASKLNIEPFKVKIIQRSTEYQEALRRSLFIGLSDGSRIDQLRRNVGLSNEQVLLTYDVSDNKVKDVVSELKKDGYSSKYNSIFLLDDFTASGTSYFRKEGDIWKGKILKTLASIFSNSGLSGLVDQTELPDIHLIFYIATRSSLQSLEDRVLLWRESEGKTFNFTIEAVQVIEDNVRDSVIQEREFIEIAANYFDKNIISPHFKKAKYSSPWLGYNECALPLIIVHNTPNNSLPILWHQEREFVGLFPRITRHK